MFGIISKRMKNWIILGLNDELQEIRDKLMTLQGHRQEDRITISRLETTVSFLKMEKDRAHKMLDAAYTSNQVLRKRLGDA